MISLPTMAAAMGTDILGISWALIVYQMAGIGLGVVCGRLGDIYGHQKTFRIGMATLAAGSLLCGFAQTVLQLILFRFIQGIGGAMVQSSGRALGYRSMPEGSEGKAQGLMAMSHQVGFFVGPPIGGLIIDLLHWRAVFFFLFIPSVTGAALSWMSGRAATPPSQHRSAVDYGGALLFLALTVLVTLLLDQKIAAVLQGAAQMLLVFAAGGMLWAFIAHEKKTASPMIDLSFFSIPAFGYGSLGLFVACIAQGMSQFITPFYMQDVLKLSPTFMGVLFLVPSLLGIVLSPISGAMTDRIGARSLLITGVLVLMLAFLLGAALQTDSHWIMAALLLALVGIGAPLFNTPSQAVMVRSLPKQHWGIAIGIINGMFGLGHMLGVSLTGIFLTFAFRYYSGDAAATPDPRNTDLFVASMNVTYLAAICLCFVPLLTALRAKKNS